MRQITYTDEGIDDTKARHKWFWKLKRIKFEAIGNSKECHKGHGIR